MTQKDVSQDILTLIREAYDGMSSGQQKVLEFFLSRRLEAVYLSAAKIAELVDVSHSTVVRTAQALGFDGFPEFQTAFQEQISGRINSASVYQLGSRKLINELLEQDNNSMGAILERVMRTDAKNIENMVSQIPVADFEQAVAMLIEAETVYVIGLRSSAPMAMNFAMGLRQIRGKCHLLEPGVGDLVDQIAALTDKDLLFSLCFGRYSKETLHAMDYARKMGAKVISVTDTPVSPAAQRGDLVFTLRYGVWFYGASAALFSLLNALVAALLISQNEAAQTRLERIDAVIDEFGIFDSGDDQFV
ncbi:MAG: MurR/RpiR family transcriptional regulator [Chloroflexi bacterium]|nr:MurR/RpiR family transcriptional regulator [Chloroflexota bacterium]MCC6894691.1 MurR/RpiR family transcriptional regulator [Anaerolineae bacterium]